MKRKILIFGAGVIGSTYGGLLARSGHDVTMLARGKRLNELREKGLLIRRISQENPEKIPVEIIDETMLTGSYDHVFVTLRHEQVKPSLPALSLIDTPCFVFMVNNPSGYNDWINALGPERVLPAFPGSGGKIENGIVHYDIVSGFIQPTTIGEPDGRCTARLMDLREILKKAGFNVSISKNMDAWQKTHVAMVAPLGDAIYYDGGNNYTVSKNREAIRIMNLALKENFRFLRKSGIGIEPSKLRIISILPLFVMNPLMSCVFNTRWAETVISNHALNAKHEMEVITGEFLKLAESRGFRLHHMQKLMNSCSSGC